jgi:hypothetical protein
MRKAFLALALVGCSASERAESSTDDVSAGGKMQLVVTVDWEGRDLEEGNLRAMRDLHARFPQVKIVHFLNAAYFTKPGADAADAKARIASTIAGGDEKGLHIHGWKRLFEASGVTFKTSPTFWGTALRSEDCTSDCGHEVPISLYSADELRKVVKFSIAKLEENGLGHAKSFRCGGWIAKDNVREAIAAEGIRFDHSAVPTPFLAGKLSGTPLLEWLGDLWDTNELSQPHRLGDLVEVPDNGALADYVTTEQMTSTFEANKAEYLRDRKKNVVVSIGFHQETAERYLPQVEAALERIYDTAEREHIPLESVTSEALSR